MTHVKTPADETEARAIQDELRKSVVLDEPGPAPGSGLVAGVDVAYDDERDLVAAAAVVLDLSLIHRQPSRSSPRPPPSGT